MAAYDDNRENGDFSKENDQNITPEQPAEEKASGETERPSVSYTPHNSYNPYGGYGAPGYRPSGYSNTPKPRTSNARVIVLCSVLVVALLVVSFFGGAALGRFTNYGYAPDLGGETENDGTPDNGGSSNGENAGINRGDVLLNVIERDPTEYGEQDIPTVVTKVQDMVVEIRTETTVTSAYYGDYVQSGAGSGVIVSEDGLILTCDHVISGAGTITVVLTDGREFIAEIYGEDSWSDLALIKIDATGLPAAELPAAAAKDDASYKSYLSVGEEVIAIGNPLGELGGSVSNGIISALGRKVSVEGVPMTLMQTNAAVNPGNSGGGLFNMYGELIGIVNAKSTGDSVEGIGFAIPVSDAIVVYRQLYSQGYVSGRPYLGLYFEESTNGLKIISYDYNDELTGGQTIQSGDMLYSADGTVITSFSDLKTVLANKKVGDTMVIQVERYERRGYSYIRIPLEFTITVHEYIPVTNQ
ncbi:MAG: trypsin-like peptidase domain-containing protein [Clostridia bacterium]|nr:trypsin-like peptidase domain-containing protein [Clostridia bacterium]